MIKNRGLRRKTKFWDDYMVRQVFHKPKRRAVILDHVKDRLFIGSFSTVVRINFAMRNFLLPCHSEGAQFMCYKAILSIHKTQFVCG